MANHTKSRKRWHSQGVETLRSRTQALEAENRALRSQLAEFDNELYEATIDYHLLAADFWDLKADLELALNAAECAAFEDFQANRWLKDAGMSSV